MLSKVKTLGSSNFPMMKKIVMVSFLLSTLFIFRIEIVKAEMTSVYKQTSTDNGYFINFKTTLLSGQSPYPVQNKFVLGDFVITNTERNMSSYNGSGGAEMTSRAWIAVASVDSEPVFDINGVLNTINSMPSSACIEHYWYLWYQGSLNCDDNNNNTPGQRDFDDMKELIDSKLGNGSQLIYFWSARTFLQGDYFRLNGYFFNLPVGVHTMHINYYAVQYWVPGYFRLFEKISIPFEVASPSTSDVDIGLHVNQGTSASPSVVNIGAEQGIAKSPLRIAKNGMIYGVKLVNPTDVNASKVLIKISDGIKALKKYVAGSGSANFVRTTKTYNSLSCYSNNPLWPSALVASGDSRICTGGSDGHDKFNPDSATAAQMCKIAGGWDGTEGYTPTPYGTSNPGGYWAYHSDGGYYDTPSDNAVWYWTGTEWATMAAGGTNMIIGDVTCYKTVVN